MRFLLLLVLCITFSFSHNTTKTDIELSLINNQLVVTTNIKSLSNLVQLISMVDKRVLSEKNMIKGEKLIFDIPSESYWVCFFNDNEKITKVGLPPKEGFLIVVKSHENEALYFSLITSISFLIFGILIGIYKVRKSKL